MYADTILICFLKPLNHNPLSFRIRPPQPATPAENFAAPSVLRQHDPCPGAFQQATDINTDYASIMRPNFHPLGPFDRTTLSL